MGMFGIGKPAWPVCQHGYDVGSCLVCEAESYNGLLVRVQSVYGALPSAQAAPEPTPVRVETAATEIMGWRSWFLDLASDGEVALRSYVYPVIWEGPRLVADKVPTPENAHGIYATNTPPAEPHKVNRPYFTQVPIVGEVALSGTVVCGANGYRAEQAMVRSLELVQGCRATDDARWLRVDEILAEVPLVTVRAVLEQRYDCPVEIVPRDAIFSPGPAKTGTKAEGY